MPVFECRTRDASGSVVQKTVDAANRREAIQLLEQSGLSPVRIAEVDAPPAASEPAPAEAQAPVATSPKKRQEVRRKQTRKVKQRELMQFSTQLAGALDAGVPILAGIRLASEQTANEAFHRVLVRMLSDLEGGLPLSEAMKAHPKVFPPAYIGTIEAGEASGTIVEMLENLAEYLEADMEMRSDVRSALLYPAIVTGTLCLAVVVMIVFIVPRFASFYAGFDTKLPLATRLLIGASSFASDYALVVIAAMAATVYGIRRLVRVPVVQERIDRALLRVPVFGKIIEISTTLHVVQVLGLFTRAGVPILQAMRTVADTTRNSKFRQDLNAVAAGVAVGHSLSEGMEEVGCLPLSARHMIATGEATGGIDRACFAVARHFKKELRYATKSVTTFIEPILTLVLAVVVLFVALAVFLPMWDLVKVVGK